MLRVVDRSGFPLGVSRPGYDPRLERRVVGIIEKVRRHGDRAVRNFTRRFDGVSIPRWRVCEEEMTEALSHVGDGQWAALRQARHRLRRFAARQREQLADFTLCFEPGVHTGQRVIPIQRVGIYVPGGRYPLVSSLLMCAVPAQVAGVEEIVVCSPPRYRGKVHPLLLACARLLGIREVYAAGGAQAVAAMAYGTESLQAVDKIVGPGNRIVATAKKQVSGDVGIDFWAGPSEVLVVADETASASWIAADLIAQAEHDEQAVAMVLTPAATLPGDIVREVCRQLKSIKTARVASRALKRNGWIVRVHSLEEAVDLANLQAPEHLELHVSHPDVTLERFRTYGSLFIGGESAEVLGDYGSGLNHTLPTGGAARFTGGLSPLSFLKAQTTLRVNHNGLCRIGSVCRSLAEMEGMAGHVAALRIRQDSRDVRS